MSESYPDRLMRIIASLQNCAMDRPETQKLKREAIAFIREQAQVIVRLENELETAYGS